jgi:hypothetical protein
MSTCSKVTFAVLLLIALPLSAEIVKPNLRCGSPIPREGVKVLDVTELPPDKVGIFVREQVGGNFEIVKEEEVQAGTVFGRAWKKAEKQAAALGCPFVILLGSRREITGYWKPDPFAPGPATTPVTKDTAMVLYVMPSDP